LRCRSGNLRIEELRARDLDRIGEIDRAESVRVLYVREGRELRPVEAELQIPAWDDAVLAAVKERLAAKLAAGGVLLGALDGERLVGGAVLGGERLGIRSQQLEVAFLYVSDGYRRRGIATALLDEVCRRAHERGAEELSISASDTGASIGFYLRYGCRPAERAEGELAGAEPTDIALTLALTGRPGLGDPASGGTV
jgi:ribosomal protein S18 acetylase RimI-like enzyme